MIINDVAATSYIFAKTRNRLYTHRIVGLFFVFAQFCQHVRQNLCEPNWNLFYAYTHRVTFGRPSLLFRNPKTPGSKLVLAVKPRNNGTPFNMYHNTRVVFVHNRYGRSTIFAWFPKKVVVRNELRKSPKQCSKKRTPLRLQLQNDCF